MLLPLGVIPAALLNNLPAAKRGALVLLDDYDLIMALGSATVSSIPFALDRLTRAGRRPELKPIHSGRSPLLAAFVFAAIPISPAAAQERAGRWLAHP